MTTEATNDQPEWAHWLTVALHALIIWPTQYLIVAPIVTLAGWSWAILKGAAKIGVGAILLLFIPVIGWLILGVWLIVRSNDKKAERRHQETMAAMGYELTPDQKGTPMWQTVWVPWKLGL